MTGNRRIIVTKETLRWWKSYYSGKIPTCSVCGEEFKEGDIVISKSRTRTNCKRTHEKHQYSEPITQNIL